jgi:hypothetical protein
MRPTRALVTCRTIRRSSTPRSRHHGGRRAIDDHPAAGLASIGPPRDRSTKEAHHRGRRCVGWSAPGPRANDGRGIRRMVGAGASDGRLPAHGPAPAWAQPGRSRRCGPPRALVTCRTIRRSSTPRSRHHGGRRAIDDQPAAGPASIGPPRDRSTKEAHHRGRRCVGWSAPGPRANDGRGPRRMVGAGASDAPPRAHGRTTAGAYHDWSAPGPQAPRRPRPTSSSPPQPWPAHRVPTPAGPRGAPGAPPAPRASAAVGRCRTRVRRRTR